MICPPCHGVPSSSHSPAGHGLQHRQASLIQVMPAGQRRLVACLFWHCGACVSLTASHNAARTTCRQGEAGVPQPEHSRSCIPAVGSSCTMLPTLQATCTGLPKAEPSPSQCHMDTSACARQDAAPITPCSGGVQVCDPQLQECSMAASAAHIPPAPGRAASFWWHAYQVAHCATPSCVLRGCSSLTPQWGQVASCPAAQEGVGSRAREG